MKNFILVSSLALFSSGCATLADLLGGGEGKVILCEYVAKECPPAPGASTANVLLCERAVKFCAK